MKYICFSILGKTLCGREDEPVPEHLADSRRFCNDCVQVMWKEQYRRRVLSGISVPKQEKVKEVASTPKAIKPLRHYLKVKA